MAHDASVVVFLAQVVTLLAFGPGLAMIALIAVSGRGTFAMWGYPLWLFVGLWIVLMLRTALDRARLAHVIAHWGVVFAILALKSSPRPGTNADSTAPGDTDTTRTAGASALASASPTTTCSCTTGAHRSSRGSASPGRWPSSTPITSTGIRSRGWSSAGARHC